MVTRKKISKTIRFEIFKRDSFTCQYCGKKAPDVLLEIEHIEPVSKGGTNDFLNLITACKECNAGKSDRKLSDSTVLDKQRLQLDELQERAEQIKMMFQWQKGLTNLDDQIIKELAEFWSEQVPGDHLTESGIAKLKRLKREFNIGEIMIAMQIAVEKYIIYNKGIPIDESVSKAYEKVGGICKNRLEERDHPHMLKLRYIRGILRNRLNYFDERLAMELLEKAFEANVHLDSLKKHAKSVRNWTDWRYDIEEFIRKQSGDASIEYKLHVKESSDD